MSWLIVLSLLWAMASTLPQLSVSSPHGQYAVHTDDGRVARGLGKRQSTISTNVFDVLSWSYAGQYRVNSKPSPPKAIFAQR